MKLKSKSTLSRFFLLSVCLAAARISFAQDQLQRPSEPIEILKFKWEKQVRLPRSFDPSIISTNGRSGDARNPLSPPAMGAPTNAADLTRAATKARDDAAAADGVFPMTPGRLPVFYVYSMKVRNTGAKTIEGLVWDYIFFDTNGIKPLGSHQFLSYQKLTRGKITTLQRALRSPPVRVVDASASKSTRPNFTEKAVIECVLYSDSSVWRSPIAREGICELLKTRSAKVVR